MARDALTGNYEPGPLSLRLGLLNLEHQPAYRAAAPRVSALALATGMSVAVSVAGPQGPTIVRYERGGHPLHVNLHVGTVMSLSATSTGRVFRAFDDASRVLPIRTRPCRPHELRCRARKKQAARDARQICGNQNDASRRLFDDSVQDCGLRGAAMRRAIRWSSEALPAPANASQTSSTA